MTGDQAATYMDHYYLNFWLWACLHDGEAYLAASSALHAMIADVRTSRVDILTFSQRRVAAQREMELAKYHFVTAVGSLLRNLERSQRLFPSIRAVCDQAQHLFAEGKELRDMIEHADDYTQGRGQKQAGFVREVVGVATNLPGDRPGIADATSTIVDENGHWLGGRLNVESVIAEVRAIAVVAAPQDRYLAAHPRSDARPPLPAALVCRSNAELAFVVRDAGSQASMSIMT